MNEHPSVITVKNLKTYIYANQRCNKAIKGISFEVKRGRTLCIVGESGSGKSLTALSMMRLLPPLSRIESGEIIYHSDEGKDIRIDQLPPTGSKMRSLRGAEIAMIFQDPMTALNPVYSVGFQVLENLLYHSKLRAKKLRLKAVDLLRDMGIPMPEQRYNEYPHQYSGGMRQRGMIAMAMACSPKVLIADEPTTALDVTIQAQIFELMEKLKKEQNTAIMLITHDMGVVAELADDVAVMYMGTIVEQGSLQEIFSRPAHPYTKALLASIPTLGKGKNQTLKPIQGTTPDPYKHPQGCAFHPRCRFKSEVCTSSPPPLVSLTPTHSTLCFHSKELQQEEDKSHG